MKIAITATEPSLDAKVDPRFGRCPYFLIVDTDSLNFEPVENPNVGLGGGAGIQSAQLMGEKGVKFVLTGNCGPNAYQTLSAVGISVIVGCSGTVADVVEQFKAGRLKPAGEPNVAGKFGVAGPGSPDANQSAGPQQPPMVGGGMGAGRGGGRGMGGGMGRGGGGGVGRGMGQGRGQGMGGAFPQGPVPIAQPPAQDLTKDDELGMLKQQADVLSRQMQQIQERIKQLEQEG